MFEVGQKVVVIKSDHAKKGATGVVVAIDDDKEKHTIGVMLSTPVRGGHDCDGECPEGYGRWFSPDQLVKIID